MHPVIFKYQIPNFFKGFLGIESITLYSYAFFIVLGTVLAAKYAKINSKKANLEVLPNTFFYTIFIGGFIGGKIFTWLENPKKILDLENVSIVVEKFVPEKIVCQIEKIFDSL